MQVPLDTYPYIPLCSLDATALFYILKTGMLLRSFFLPSVLVLLDLSGSRVCCVHFYRLVSFLWHDGHHYPVALETRTLCNFAEQVPGYFGERTDCCF